LVEAMIALCLFELLREAASSIRIAHGEHVRMVPEVVVDDPEEPEYEARGPRVLRRVTERDEPAVVDHGEHELRVHHHVAAPGLLLKGDGRGAAGDVSRHFYAEFGHGQGVSASIPPVPTNIDFLKRVAMFEDLDNRSLEAIANAAVEQRYEPGQEIVRQGDTGVGAFI